MLKTLLIVQVRIVIKLCILNYNIVPFGNHGCSCGDVNKAFMYVIDNGGLDTEKAYRYVSKVRERFLHKYY